MKDEFYENLCKRLRLPDGHILTYDEVMQWPDGKLDELMRQGKVKEVSPSESVECIECPERCSIEPDVRQQPETRKRVGIYGCPYNEDIGRITVDLERMRRWEIVSVKRLKRKPRKKKIASRIAKAETSFNKWGSPGECCFILEQARIAFWNGDDLKDLRLKNNSRTHTLLTLLSVGNLTKAEVKKEICTEGTSPSEAVRDVNRTLNDKIKKLNIRNIPANVAFIDRDDRTEQYHSVLPIRSRREFDRT